MISREQALNLYKLTQVGDNRTAPDEMTIRLWREVSRQGRWTFEQALQAIIEHRTYRPGVYFEPGHVTLRVDEVRRDIRSRWYPPDPPRELADDPAAEIAWRLREAAAFLDRNLALWVAGEPLDAPAPPPPDEKRCELPAASSPARRELLVSMRKFGQCTAAEPPDPVAERAEARARQAAMWRAIDACRVCDDQGMRGGNVCVHPRRAEPVQDATAHRSGDASVGAAAE